MFTKALANPLRPAETELVFFGEPSRDGIRRPYLFDKAWTDAKRAAGLEDFQFHDLRHEAVSRFLEAGLSDQEVSPISGRKSMQMLKRYTHLRAEDLVQKLDRLARRAPSISKQQSEAGPPNREQRIIAPSRCHNE